MNQIAVEMLVLAYDLSKHEEPIPVERVRHIAGLLKHFSMRIEREDTRVLISPYWMIPAVVFGLVIGLLL